ncbi:restriction endonuclease subunit S [Aeromonas caviae]|uniref:restriction endonuclease subunit S n=1 Tax=Aeromonas caviae TaxID=648 RepID=UPI0029D6F9B3|nr:restriction endonuclease subunit S [Aeromonas caviae]MDX7821621.1 restriction endonuclease subunit S [Aeromonas caviae]
MSELVATSQQGLVGKYQPYQEYKDSGVEWLGNVPSHWTVTAVKRFASFTTGWTPPTGNDAYFGGEHLWANISDVGHRVLSTTAKTITDAGVRATRIKKSPKGSLLFSFKLSIGLVSIVGEDMYTNEAIATFLPSETFNISYMYWAAPLFIPQNAEENIYGAKLLNQERIGNASFVLPTPKEQQTIAAFLDYETARIDRLIAQQQRLIELLKEKRQAVISHAVTKGLNPDAPMKDSGVEWLGQVPEHWNVTKFGFISNVVRGGSPRPAGDPELFDGDYSPWVTVAEITKDEEVYLESTESFLTEKGSKQSRVFKRGTLLLSNSGATLGVPKILSIDANANDGVVGFEKLSVNTEYAYFYLSTLTDNLRERIKQGSGQPNLNTDIVKSIVIPLPPSGEVEAILSEIKTHRITFSVLISKADTAIKLMQERRTALISAAVTGKIDLRGWTPPAEEVAA